MTILTQKPGNLQDTRNVRWRPHGRGTQNQDTSRAGGPGGSFTPPCGRGPGLSDGPGWSPLPRDHLMFPQVLVASVRVFSSIVSQMAGPCPDKPVSDSQEKHKFPRQTNERENRKL